MLNPGNFPRPHAVPLHDPQDYNLPVPSSGPGDVQAGAADLSSHWGPLVSSESRAALGDRRDWQLLGPKLAEIARHLGQNASPEAVLEALKTTRIESSDAHRASNPMTLEGFIKARGLHLPSSHFQLSALADAVNQRAAIFLVLDSGHSAAASRNNLAGFDPAQQQYWGKPASAVISGLARHLEADGKTHPAIARSAAHLLLARNAPVFLIKDIPASVTYGSPAWVSLVVAAASIEAQTPGKVANMSFAQVMIGAESAGLQEMSATRQAEKAALLDWGVVNGIVPGKNHAHYSPLELERVRTAFNEHVAQRLSASELMEAPLPSRRAIALAKLKERFGHNVPFEEKLLKVNDAKQPSNQPLFDPNRAPAGWHSLLDIAMSGMGKHNWTSTDPRMIEAIKSKSLEFDVNPVFDQQFSQAINARKQGITAVVKHMVAQLPLADRQKLEYGKLEFFQNNTYQLGLDFTSKSLEHKNDNLLVKAEAEGGVTVYEINLKRGTIHTVPESVLTRVRERNANRVYPIEKFTPSSVSADDLNRKTLAALSVVPLSFSSARTQTIAQAFIEHLGIDNDEVVKQTKGATTYDQQMESERKVANFFLDLVPLRSAIVNVHKGQYWDGAMDLAMDVFGFVTAGAGVAGKVAKVAGSVASTAVKALKTAKILGTAAVAAFNPASGLDDLVRGGARLIGKGGTQLKGLAGELSNALFGEYKVSPSSLAGLTRNSQGVYVGLDGHQSFIRHTDNAGQTAVYEVRQVARNADGSVQARIYHNNQQTHLLVEPIQGDQWRRVGAQGGNPPTVLSDLGPEIGRGTEGVVYESLDRRSVYKDLGPTRSDSPPGYALRETASLNQYYGEGFAKAFVENGRSYIKMGKLDGINLHDIPKRSLPAEVRALLDDAVRGMEAKGVYHQDMQLGNFLYSARDNKVYPVDIQALPPDLMVPGNGLYEMEIEVYNRHKLDFLRAFNELIA